MSRSGPVLLGVARHQPAVVVLCAADLARDTGARLVCAFVDVTAYPRSRSGGAPVQPIDPDALDDAGDIAEEVRSRLSAVLAGHAAGWTFHTLAGEPAKALAQYAERIEASMIVVGGTGRHTGARVEDFLTGSVAAHLSHRQSRPVLLVPSGHKGDATDDD